MYSNSGSYRNSINVGNPVSKEFHLIRATGIPNETQVLSDCLILLVKYVAVNNSSAHSCLYNI